jgi:hypothetical protein
VKEELLEARRAQEAIIRDHSNDEMMFREKIDKMHN